MKIIILFLAFTIFSCVEDDNKNDKTAAAALLFLSSQNSSGCLSMANSTLNSVNRSTYSVTGSDCSTDLGQSFTAANLTVANNKITANSSQGSFAIASGGSKPINIEITYTLQSGGSIDVLANGTTNGASITSATGFRISESTIVAIASSGTTSTMTGTVPSSTAGTSKTLCLEIHAEGSGAHVFGWDKACANLTTSERGSYPFELEDLTTTQAGSGIGFQLKNASISSFTISNGKFGTAGRLLQP